MSFGIKVGVTETLDHFQTSLRRHLRYSLGLAEDDPTPLDLHRALSLAVRDVIIDRWLESRRRQETADAKQVNYLSIEFLIGRSLENNLRNLGIFSQAERVAREYGCQLENLLELEDDAALGNGGLGRLAACFLDSLATLDMPAYGYGINYEFGIFEQRVRHGYQTERPDRWLGKASPWLFERPQEACLVPLYGRVHHETDREGNYNPMWMEWDLLVGVPSDMPIVGYAGRTVNVLRLFAARSSDDFDIEIFNSGDYIRAVEGKITSERVSKVLYPSDAVDSGRELRLIQEYFFVACAIRDIFRRYERTHDDYEQFANKVAIQLNDTHPALAIAELMRLFVDEKGLPWAKAWELTRASCGYTNHTLLPEALERWPSGLLQHVLPRHLQIIEEINRRFLEEVEARWPGDGARCTRMSIFAEGPDKNVRMAHLAIVGSHSVNGVAEIHSRLLRERLVPDFRELWPERFNNKTNGITQRRWLLAGNPALATLITRTVGDGWVTDLDRLRDLEPLAEDSGFREEFLRVKQENKERLAQIIRETTLVEVDPQSLFAVQVKRIHEYKRQLMNVLQVIHQYLRIVEDAEPPAAPQTFIFAGKAAPGYFVAKRIIKLINNVADVVNNDPLVGDQLRVAFLPDYRVSLAERIFPAADLSVQISTAGTEASGTSNMKFALNGAVTVGTLDGANIEILEEVGAENAYIFGHRVEEIEAARAANSYDPVACCEKFPMLKRITDTLRGSLFTPREPGLFVPLWENLLRWGDPYFVLADLPSYSRALAAATDDFTNRSGWARKAILNVARIGKFSSDRTIREYARDIWGVRRI
jgi:starch phosphorylase